MPFFNASKTTKMFAKIVVITSVAFTITLKRIDNDRLVGIEKSSIDFETDERCLRPGLSAHTRTGLRRRAGIRYYP